MNIPFNKPEITKNSIEYILECFDRDKISGGGYFTKKVNAFLEQKLEVQKVLMTTSCTHALEMSAILLDIQCGDEVIIPSFTFVSTANAFALRGAKLLFCDIRSDTLNLDETKIENLISSKTKAIVPVHYAGVGCEMDSILEIARQHKIYVVEDNAHGLFGKYKGRFLGTLGDMATQSFHETKNFSCGEGGALIINKTNFVERAEIIREKGTNRSNFLRGEVDKYIWLDIGSSYLPADILAALLLAQLERRNQIQTKRKQIWNKYYHSLKDWAEKYNIHLPFIPVFCEQSYHLFYLILPSSEIRNNLINHLGKQNILSVFHYIPLHLSPMGILMGGSVGDCPVTEDISCRLLRLPFYNTLSEEEQDIVIDNILSFKF
jgi:dTDP-4-amino-4,6-dideoxygalactose transaminase